MKATTNMPRAEEQEGCMHMRTMDRAGGALGVALSAMALVLLAARARGAADSPAVNETASRPWSCGSWERAT